MGQQMSEPVVETAVPVAEQEGCADRAVARARGCADPADRGPDRAGAGTRDRERGAAVIGALGTTMRTAGSKKPFRRVDHDDPLAVARLARRSGTPTFVLN